MATGERTERIENERERERNNRYRKAHHYKERTNLS
jgi:hypothetical protein